MSYGVALRNGVPFTLGTIAALCVNATSQWSPLALWPDGVDSPGMWISPSTLPASFNDYTGTTPVATPGTVADSANPVGLALDIRAGAPDTLGPELVTNGDFSDGTTGWSGFGAVWSVSGGRAVSSVSPYVAIEQNVFTLGKRYLVSIELISGPNQVYVQVNNGGYYTTLTSVGVLSFITPIISAPNLSIITSGTVSGPASVDNISVKEIPGNHMLQSTSAARPLESARVNLLTYTEDFSNGMWQEIAYGAGSVTKTPNYSLAPDVTTTACRVVATAPTAGGTGGALRHASLLNGIYTRSIWIKSNTGASQVITLSPVESTATKTVTTTWAEYDWTSGSQLQYLMDVSLYRSGAGSDTDATCDISVWHPQLQIGTQATDYQAILTDGSSYSSTGFPIAQKYDGVDDGMATAAFSAGTLIDGMDCLIAVRRDSAAACVAGLYNGIADATKFFGMAESASGSGCVGSGAGTPTVWVDGVQLSGGTAVTRGTLHTALTVGDWHILEFRGLDLSAWTAAGFGLYTSYVFPGARGDIMLFESTASTADKDAARQYLADYYGVTLP